MADSTSYGELSCQHSDRLFDAYLRKYTLLAVLMPDYPPVWQIVVRTTPVPPVKMPGGWMLTRGIDVLLCFRVLESCVGSSTVALIRFQSSWRSRLGENLTGYQPHLMDASQWESWNTYLGQSRILLDSRRVVTLHPLKGSFRGCQRFRGTCYLLEVPIMPTYLPPTFTRSRTRKKADNPQTATSCSSLLGGNQQHAIPRYCHRSCPSPKIYRPLMPG